MIVPSRSISLLIWLNVSGAVTSADTIAMVTIRRRPAKSVAANTMRDAANHHTLHSAATRAKKVAIRITNAIAKRISHRIALDLRVLEDAEFMT